MKVIDLKICLEEFTVRNIPDSVLINDAQGNEVIDYNNPKCYYGKIPEFKIDKEGEFILDSFGQKQNNTIDINLFITQNYEDIGVYTDMNVRPKRLSDQPPTIPTNYNPFMGRLPGVPDSFYYTSPVTTTGYTNDNQLNYVKSLRVDINNQPIYTPYLNFSKDKETIFDGVVEETPDFIKYYLGAGVDLFGSTNATNISFNNLATYGVEYITYKKEFIKSINKKGENVIWKKTKFTANYGGKNEDTIGVYANLKQEELLGIVFKPETVSDVFINRGVADIFERHSLLSEMRTTDDIDNFRGGYLRT